MSDCKTCNGDRVLSYYGECAVCADCSDDLKIYDYIQSLKQQLADAENIFHDALEYIKANDNPDKEIAELIFYYRNKYKSKYKVGE